MTIYIVVRPFRSLGERYLAGQIITDPASIKRFKSKVIEGKIIALDRNASDTLARIRFLEKKLGISIEPNVRAYVKAVDALNEAEPEVTEELEVTEEPVEEIEQ